MMAEDGKTAVRRTGKHQLGNNHIPPQAHY